MIYGVAFNLESERNKRGSLGFATHLQADTIEGIFARTVLAQSSRQEKAEDATKDARVGTKLGTPRRIDKKTVTAKSG
jgi:hypothetical protein